CSFLTVGVLDFAHAMSYSGMPHFFTDNTVDKSIVLWLMARYCAALCLFLVIVCRNRKVFSEKWKYAYVIASSIFTILLLWMAIFHYERFPDMFIPGQDLTDFKLFAESGIIFLHVLTLIMLIKQRIKIALYNNH